MGDVNKWRKAQGARYRVKNISQISLRHVP